MKMIASTKVNRAQRSMETARAYGGATNELFQSAKTKPSDDSKTLFITASSDRGLCGGIHSSVSKFTRRQLVGDKEASSVVVLGDKAKSQLSRSNRNNIKLSFNQIGKDIPTFFEACAIVDSIRTSGLEFDNAEIIYNKFLSVIAYEATTTPVYSEETFKNSPNFAAYEISDDVLDNLQEFSFANNVYWARVEGHAAEMAAKRAAMENATKNAEEMIGKLRRIYNRGRQAVITNELIDIITGASAL
jgi:F-type H+-transporting ATPase subunit gamma